jgi:hypothetical protein
VYRVFLEDVYERLYTVSKYSSPEIFLFIDNLAKSASMKIDVNKFFKKISIR